jgi:hypothetical protein
MSFSLCLALRRLQQVLTNPDSKRCSVLCLRENRLDATLGCQNLAYDVARLQLKCTSRYVVILFSVGVLSSHIYAITVDTYV